MRAPQLASDAQEGEVCVQLLLLCVKSAGYEATVSQRPPVLHVFCMTSPPKRSVSIPHLCVSALQQCAVSYQLVRKSASFPCLLRV